MRCHRINYQVKFHVAMDGALTAEALMDPNFINAKSTSILQRLQAIQRLFAPRGMVPGSTSIAHGWYTRTTLWRPLPATPMAEFAGKI